MTIRAFGDSGAVFRRRNLGAIRSFACAPTVSGCSRAFACAGGGRINFTSSATCWGVACSSCCAARLRSSGWVSRSAASGVTCRASRLRSSGVRCCGMRPGSTGWAACLRSSGVRGGTVRGSRRAMRAGASCRRTMGSGCRAVRGSRRAVRGSRRAVRGSAGRMPTRCPSSSASAVRRTRRCVGGSRGVGRWGGRRLLVGGAQDQAAEANQNDRHHRVSGPRNVANSKHLHLKNSSISVPGY